ncbi:MAG: MBL fold metallo-hydrolase [Deltaproteobacteria bacterium]|nr:MBL fold metallo-hydrolase [Deltaproteobacteria bacterium]
MKRDRTAAPVLRFLGATGTVTGSRFLLETPRARVLVDCGLFQGLKPLRLRNWSPFPVDPASIDAVALTHAHLDHSGYLPALARNGFRGPIYATDLTHALARIVLPDSAHLQEEDAGYANRRGTSRHVPALPLYTSADAERALGQFRAAAFFQGIEIAPGVRATFLPAGHILGSAMVLLAIEGAKPRALLVSGDLGRPHHPILNPPADPPPADLVLIESTYGDRRHEDAAALARFEETIARTAARGGTIVIPSFAVDRTEVLLLHLRRLIREGRVPNLPVYVDSPMALAALDVYRRAIAAGGLEIRPDFAGDGDPFDPGNLIEAHTVEDSIAINDARGPSIIVSASGMASGGRVLHHLARRLPDERNAVLLVGFQAEGTRGRALADGARELKMHGRYIGVRAEVASVPAFSVHADRDEIVAWLRRAPRAPETVFVVHGEEPAAQGLHDAIEQQLGWTAAVPRYLEIVRVD